MKTLQEIQETAIHKLATWEIKRIYQYIDNQIPLPSCIQKRLKALSDRDTVKRKVNEAAQNRLTKVTRPSLIK